MSKQNDDVKFDGNYTLRHARNFIYVSYEKAGVRYNIDALERSPVGEELGKIPESWNSGLFRYLDECISLANNAEYALLFAVAHKKDTSISALIVLLHQIKANAVAIRVLENHGLDDQSRITLRALYENCIAFCRAVVDADFREAFSSAKSAEETNEFWHRNVSKSKCETYLIKYNETAEQKCFFVLGDTFKEVHKVLGISAHPNYLFSSFQLRGRLSDVETLDAIASAHHAATEFVLVNTCNMLLCAISFIGSAGKKIGDGVPTFVETTPQSLLSLSKTADVALQRNGEVAALMFLMLTKWLNRQRKDFDPGKHF
jgi:hypothetical protein